MKPAEALDILGRPINFSGSPRPGFRPNDPDGLGDYWVWEFEWGQLDMKFDQQDHCCFIEYFTRQEGWVTLVDLRQ